jgi:hypothetical protein
MNTRLFQAEGHLIDSGLLSGILNTILQENGDYRISSFHVGKQPEEISRLSISVSAESQEHLQHIADRLTSFGVYEQRVDSAVLVPAVKDKHAPHDFYSTTNHRTEVYYQGRWYEVSAQRMDAVIVYDESDGFSCVKLRDVKQGDMIVCGSDAVRVYPPAIEHRHEFAFMSNDVSSERSGEGHSRRTQGSP